MRKKDKTITELEDWYKGELADINRRTDKAIEVIKVQEGRRDQLEQLYRAERKRLFHF